MPSTTQYYWTKNLLDRFIEDPEALYQDTTMYFMGMKDPWQRACVIEYLHFLKGQTIEKLS